MSDVAAVSALTALAAPLRVASIHVAYARPVPGGSTAVFAATVRHQGRSFGVVDVEGRVDGKTCVVARVSVD